MAAPTAPPNTSLVPNASSSSSPSPLAATPNDDSPIASLSNIRHHFNLMAISGAVESRIIELERQIEWERKEKEELRAKYVSNLEEMERKHQKKIKEMKKEMQQLRLQLKESNERVRVLEGGLGEMKKLHQDEMNDLRKEMNKMAARERRKQHRLLCGSVGYNYIRAAIEYVFHNRHDLDQLMERLHSIEGIRAEMGEADEARWREFDRTYYSPMYDEPPKEADERSGRHRASYNGGRRRG
jgi:vacuolar-type H+-ATPase subunit I/STV1